MVFPNISGHIDIVYVSCIPYFHIITNTYGCPQRHLTRIFPIMRSSSGRKVRVGILLTDGSSRASLLSGGAKLDTSVWAGVILRKKRKTLE